MKTNFKPSRILFYILSFTWGIILSTLGLVASLALRALGYRQYPNQYGYVIFIGNNSWGGFTLGPYSFVCPDAPTSRPLYYVKDRENLSNFDEYYIIPEQNAIGYRGETVAMFTEITYCRNTERREDMLTFTAYSLVNNPIATGEIWLN